MCLTSLAHGYNEIDENYLLNRSYDHGNGRPNCTLQSEFQRRWRNNWDPKRYWVCSRDGSISYVCGTELMYQDQRQCCVHWSTWVWTPPFNPPTAYMD